MSVCAVCRKTITSAQASAAVQILDDKGRLTGVRHGKCKRREVRLDRNESQGMTKAPSAYDMSSIHKTKDDIAREALQASQDALAAERSKEEVPHRHDDYRDPIEADIEDVVDFTDLMKQADTTQSEDT